MDISEGAEAPKERPVRIFLHSYVVTALNPKSIFFVAFLPQMIVFETTLLVLAILNATFFAAGIVRPKVDTQAQRASGRQRTGGTLMIGAGLLAAGWKRA